LKTAIRRRSRRRITTLIRRRILKMITLRGRRRRRQGSLSLRQPRRLSIARSTFLAFNLYTL
jgi:ABC-type branched-subunit amino acid transport system ATPase component